MIEETIEKPKSQRNWGWLFGLLLALILAVGLYLRLTGIAWDEGIYLHPDERFLMFVESSIQPVQSIAEYFNTQNSSLNPHNVGHPLFVYGTFPIFVVRYLLDALEISGAAVYEIGRPLSALANIGTVLIVYLVGARAYDRRIGLLGAAFASFSVLAIQLSHFFKEDTFMAFFTTLALYIAVVVATKKDQTVEKSPSLSSDEPQSEVGEVPPESMPAAGERGAKPPSIFRSQLFLFLSFGLVVAMAMASKINAAPIAFAIPLAVFIRISRLPAGIRTRAVLEGVGYLVLSGIVAFVAFRILQPYAFSGPGILGLAPNPEWLDDLRELQAITSPESIFGFPPSLQWADRPVWFSFANIVRWGLGIPLGILAWAGFFWAGWRMVRGQWRTHILIWSWTGLYFLWQSSVFNPTMRYQLPIYPTLALFAAWAVFTLWDRGATDATRGWVSNNWPKAAAGVIGVSVLAGTIIYALAFTNIYNRPVTRVAASRWIFENIPGPINLVIEGEDSSRNHPIPVPSNQRLNPGAPYTTSIVASADGNVSQIYIHRLVDHEPRPGTETLKAALSAGDNPGQILAEGEARFDLPPDERGRGHPVTILLDRAVNLEADKVYQLVLNLESDNNASIEIKGSALATESSWDDALPLRVDGFDGYGGIYEGGLNFEMYWEDSPEKLDRFISTMDQAEYIMISSSRQWDSVGRLPDRFPISNAYYRLLIGCPADLTIEECYNTAEPGAFAGQIGFDLVRTFQSDPTLGPFSINDQASEEAFTVYDHPKVFIFQKTEGFDPDRTRSILEAAYFASPAVASPNPPAPDKDLLLPEDQLAGQREGGTWSALFNSEGLLNRFPWLGAGVWYLALALMGLIAYPLLRVILPGLADRGFPAVRAAGVLILSYLVWLAGSMEVPFSRFTITVIVVILALLAAAAAYFTRQGIRQELRENWKYFLIIEGLFLGVFIVGLLIRYANPDLWHPWKGGEKPMDFSYFNAVLKSTTFPPYDPWFSGGYINYYYYGFVYVGVLVKWLGIQPSIAYNFVIPTIFAMIALGAFSMGWNLFKAVRPGMKSEPEAERPGEMVLDEPAIGRPDAIRGQVENDEPAGAADDEARSKIGPWLAGAAAMLGMAILGNLGIIAMVVKGYQRLAAGGASLDEAGLITRAIWTGEGFLKALTGSGLPYSVADWYWIPSRAIPAPNDIEPITEFPMFTVLYADLHAHLIVLPIALLAIGWSLSVILGKARWQSWAAGILGLFFGALAIGALRPTNTWDFYPYLAIGALALGYAVIRYFDPPVREGLNSNPARWAMKAAAAAVGVVLLVALAHLLFQPYAQWYGQGYNAVDVWRGSHTTITAYFVHWGLFLFVIVSWLIWETRQWMASTPLSALRKIEPYRGLVIVLIIAAALVIAALILLEVNVSVLVIPVAIWAGLLILRPGMPDAKRSVLFITGTGLTLTLMVEVIVLRGDIGRMNTVFKFYLQVWTFFSISAAAALGWLFLEIPTWTPNWRKGWQLSLAILVGVAAMYPLLASVAKIRDRMTDDAPLSLDGMEYMNHSTYFDLNTELDLSQDYGAIRWMQENIEGSPVIVEGNMVEYHWGSRYSIYTGLPGVLGWNWHQRQQRAILTSGDVERRLEDINAFYQVSSEGESRAFLDKYGVRFIVVGQLERALYEDGGLSKFEQYDGSLWNEVYRDRDTVIYEVIGETG